MDYLFTVLIILASALIIYFLIQNKLTSYNMVNGFVEDYYDGSEFKIIQISSLNMREKLKYGVPLIPFVRLLTFYPYNFFSVTNDKYFRKIDTVDDSQEEQIRYVEVVLNNGVLVEINEFDVYDY